METKMMLVDAWKAKRLARTDDKKAKYQIDTNFSYYLMDLKLLTVMIG